MGDLISVLEGIRVPFAPADEGGTAPAAQVYDLVLQAVGRMPNSKKIAAEKAGVAVTDRGFISVDIQMRTNVSHIFAIGDIVGQPMLAHKAVYEAHVAAEVIAGELQATRSWPSPPSTPAPFPGWPTPTWRSPGSSCARQPPHP